MVTFLKMKLPSVNGQLDTETMEIVTVAVMKLVIKSVVQYADNKIDATKRVVRGHQENR